MVETAVKFRKFAESERRNDLRIPARFHAVRRIREERRHRQIFHDGFRLGKRALHFVVDDAVVRERRLTALQLIMPAFLHQNLRIFQTFRIKDRVKIHVHQVSEIFFIAARDGIHRLVRPRHRVQKRIERSLGQLDEGFFQRKFPRTAERRVLHDVRRALGIVRRRAKRDVKHIVVIRRVQIQKMRARPFMIQQIRVRIHFGNPRHLLHGKTVNDLSDFEFHILSLISHSGAPVSSVSFVP